MIVTLKNTFDVGYKDMGAAYQIQTQVYNIAAAVLQINPGEPVIVASQNPTLVAPAADGDGIIGTDIVLGISAGYSTQTATVAGTVEVWQADRNTIFRSRPKVNFADQAAADAAIGKRVVFDLTSGKYTIDTAATTGATNGVIIVNADFATQLVDFKLDPEITNY